jgi:hypothetical protein
MFGRISGRFFGCAWALLAAIGVVAFIFTLGGSGVDAQAAGARSAPVPGGQAPRAALVSPTPDGCPGGYHYFVANEGGPENGGTALQNQQITLKMMLHPGPYYVTVHQAYLTFTYQLLQNVSTYVNRCALSTGISPDFAVFDFQLQNEVCNGPEPCLFRGVIIPPGYMAFASGAWVNPAYNGPDFRVAEIGLCMTAPGEAILHWQFMPPDPLVRDTEIVDQNSEIVSVRECYQDYVINILGAAITATYTRTPTRTATPTFTPTPTITVTPTRTATATRTPCVFNFSDVHPTDYFYQAALHFYCRGVISGYSDYTFRPFNNTTRAQLCKIVVLAEGWHISAAGQPFSDVPPDHPFYNYIMTTYERGVIRGYADGTFRPYNNVTRGQLCKIVVLAEGWPVDTTGGPHFSDVPETDTFYAYVETSYNRQIISGYADHTFRPGNGATRGQVCKILYTAIGR